jgi:hypothetical protein
MAGADLLWEKSTAGWLLAAGLFWEKSTVGWWLISRTNRLWIMLVDCNMSNQFYPLFLFTTCLLLFFPKFS